MIIQLSLQIKCPQAYPKILGTSTGDTKIYALDYCTSNSQYVVVGGSTDQNLKGTTSSTSEEPIIIKLYEGAIFPISWSNYISNPGKFTGVAISPNCDIAVTHTQQTSPPDYMIVFNMTNGAVINARSYTDSGYEQRMQSILISSDSKVYYMASNPIRLIKFPAYPFAQGVTWAKQSNSLTLIRRGLIFGETENVIYGFRSDSNYLYMQRTNTANGDFLWDYRLALVTGVSQFFSLKYFSTFGVIFISTRETDSSLINFLKIKYQGTTIQEGIKLNVATDTVYSLNAVHLVDENNGKALISQIIVGQYANQLESYVLSINFAMNAYVLQKEVQNLHNGDFSYAKFISDNNYFYIGYADGVYTKSTSYGPLGTKYSVIIKNDFSISCQLQATDSAQSKTPTVANTGTFSNSGYSTGSIYTTVTSTFQFTNEAVTASPINQDKLIYTGLFCTTNNNIYNFTEVKQPATTFRYSSNKDNVFSISPYQATMKCGVPTTTTIKYSSNSLSLYISVSDTDGKVTIAKQEIGDKMFKITGTVQEDTTYFYGQDFTFLMNHPPGFSSVLQNVTVNKLIPVQYFLPATTDIDGDTVSISTYQEGQAQLPSFVSYWLSTYNIDASNVNVGDFKITVELQDGLDTSIFSFFIIVSDVPKQQLSFSEQLASNLGPPMFSEDLPVLQVDANAKLQYQLPSISDPDGDSYSIKVSLSDALTFTKLVDNSKFTFEPKASHVKSAAYKIKIVLTDENPIKTMSSTYYLSVQVTSPPEPLASQAQIQQTTNAESNTGNTVEGTTATSTSSQTSQQNSTTQNSTSTQTDQSSSNASSSSTSTEQQQSSLSSNFESGESSSSSSFEFNFNEKSTKGNSEMSKKQKIFTVTEKVSLKLIKIDSNGTLEGKILAKTVDAAKLILKQLMAKGTIAVSFIEAYTSFKSDLKFEIDQDASFSSEKIKLYALFNDPSKISLQQEQDKLQVTVLKDIKVSILEGQIRSIYTLRKGTQSLIPIPPQKSIGNINEYSQFQQIGQIMLQQKIASTMQMTSISVASATAIMNIFLSMFIQILFSFLNDISFLMVLNLISLNIPGISQVIQNQVMNFIYLDFYQTDKWIPQLLPSPNADEEIDVPLSSFFDQSGFSTQNFVLNLGSTIVNIIVLLFLYIVLFVFFLLSRLLRWQEHFSQVTPLQCKQSQELFAIKSVLEPPVAVFNAAVFSDLFIELNKLKYCKVIASQFIYFLQLSLASKASKLNSVLNILITSTVVFSILAMAFIIIQKKKQGELQRQEFQDRFRPIVEDLNTSSIIGALWNIIVLLRWLITITILVKMRDDCATQIVFLLSISWFAQFIILYLQPLKNKFENRMLFVNEFMISVYLYFAFSMTDFNLNMEIYPELGWGVTGIIFFVIFLNLIKAAIEIVQTIKEYCQKKKNQRAAKYSDEVTIISSTNTKRQKDAYEQQQQANFTREQSFISDNVESSVVYIENTNIPIQKDFANMFQMKIAKNPALQEVRKRRHLLLQ